MGIGGVFFGWGVALAITSVFVAPILTRRIGLVPTLLATLGALSVLMLVLSVFHTSMTFLVVLIIIGGLLLGVMNTALTETVMEATDLPRSVASSSYSGVRFLGGAVAPAAAGPPAAATSAGAPYRLATGTRGVAVRVLVLGRKHVTAVCAHSLSAVEEAESITLGDEGWADPPHQSWTVPSARRFTGR